MRLKLTSTANHIFRGLPCVHSVAAVAAVSFGVYDSGHIHINMGEPHSLHTLGYSKKGRYVGRSNIVQRLQSIKKKKIGLRASNPSQKAKLESMPIERPRHCYPRTARMQSTKLCSVSLNTRPRVAKHQPFQINKAKKAD